MAGVAYKGAGIAQVTASGHVPIKYWNPSYCSEYDTDGVTCLTYAGGYYSYSTASASVDGTINGGSSSVFVNGKSVARDNDSTTETDSPNIPSGWSQNGGDSGGTGSISGGDSGVYVNGSKVAIDGTSVTTHAGVNTTINQSSSNVFAS